MQEVCEGGLDVRFDYAAEVAARFGRDRDSGRQLLYLWLRWWRDLLLIKEGADEYLNHTDRTTALQLQASRLSTAQVLCPSSSVSTARWRPSGRQCVKHRLTLGDADAGVAAAGSGSGLVVQSESVIRGIDSASEAWPLKLSGEWTTMTLTAWWLCRYRWSQ